MASETWEKLSLAEKEANALVDEAKAKSATLLAKVRQALQEERTKTLEEARRLGEEAVAQRKAEAEEKPWSSGKRPMNELRSCIGLAGKSC